VFCLGWLIGRGNAFHRFVVCYKNLLAKKSLKPPLITALTVTFKQES